MGAPDAQLFCLDVSYCHALLTAGCGLVTEEAEVTLVKQVEYKGAAIEAAWPLGAAVNALG
jgi:apyrase